jgi:DinB superfamily
MEHAAELRRMLVNLLKGGQAYDTFEEIVASFGPGVRGVVPPKAERSAWQVLCHMQLSLRDSLDWAQNQDGLYKEKDWPEGYWPVETEPPTDTAWAEKVQQYLSDRDELADLAMRGDLFRPFEWDDKHNLTRQILLAADHSAYHCGQLVFLRRLLP